MDLQSGLLAVKQTVKLSEGLWMAIDLISVFSRESTLFLAISLHMWASRALLWYWILCYSDVELRYTNTFLYARMASTIPSFLLFTQNKLIKTTAIHRSMKNSFPPLRHAAALLGCFLTHRHAGYRWELSRRKKKQQINNSNSNNSINNSNLSLLLIFFRPDRSFRKSHFLCGVYWFAFNQSKTLN